MTEDDFFDSVAAMKSMVSNNLLIDNPLEPTSHNLSARILRHGLSVSSFAFLEHYLGLAFRAFMLEASLTRVAYSDMTEDFRKFVSISAASGLLNRVNFKPNAQRLPYFEAEASVLTQFLNAPAHFSWHGFSPRGSNVGKDDVASALKALGVEKPWEKLTIVTSVLGSHRANLASDYENLAATRHSSAHDPTGNVASSDLETNITVANLIAISVSLMLRTLASIYKSARNARELRDRARNPSVNVRFLDEEIGGNWLERSSSSGRVIKRYADRSAAITRANSRNGDASIVMRDSRGIPVRLA